MTDSSPGLRPCAVDLACPATAHDRACPWHPANTVRLEVPAGVYANLLKELDRPARPMPKLRQLLAGGRRKGRAW